MARSVPVGNIKDRLAVQMVHGPHLSGTQVFSRQVSDYFFLNLVSEHSQRTKIKNLTKWLITRIRDTILYSN